MPEVSPELLEEQRLYYRARAAEYDQWWNREGRYDRGSTSNAQWHRERQEVVQVFERIPFGGEVLELAPGTGLWTERLVSTGISVTAVDASEEMLAVNRARLGPRSAKVNYLVADLFDWSPSCRFDAVVFCFWISHVPQQRLERFLSMVADGLRPGGIVFFLDGRREPTSTAKDHPLPVEGSETMVRRLNDGREFHIVKNFWTPTDLQERFRRAGLAIEVHETANFFQYGVGRKELGRSMNGRASGAPAADRAGLPRRRVRPDVVLGCPSRAGTLCRPPGVRGRDAKAPVR